MRQQLLEKLLAAAENPDQEAAHFDADQALLDYINDPEISKVFNDMPKWYA